MLCSQRLLLFVNSGAFGHGCTRVQRRDVCVMARRPSNRKGKKNGPKKKAARPAKAASTPSATPKSNDDAILIEDGLVGQEIDLTPESLMAYEPGNTAKVEGLGPASKRRTPTGESEAPTAKATETDLGNRTEEEVASTASDALAPTANAEIGSVDSDAPRLKLPDLPKSSSGGRTIRRRRRKQAAAAAAEESSAKSDLGVDDMTSLETGDAPLPSREIERLTQGYRTGQDAELLRKIEVEPDYMFKSGQAQGEYELASAIIGTGRPNEQGVYTQPYVQSAHIVLAAVLLLGANVYYPGFPLTEGSEELRMNVKLALGLVYTVNAALAVYAYGEAKKRGQPPILWTLKVALLGNIALQELRDNAPLTSKTKKVDKAAKRRIRQRK